jgi:hypothetical protein
MYQHVILFPNISLLQMPSRTRAHDGAGTSRGQDDTPNPPPVPPTLAEAIAALVIAIADVTPQVSISCYVERFILISNAK